MEKKFVNVKEIAEMLNESPYTIRDWTARGKIPYYKRGRRLQYNIDEIAQWDKDINYRPARNWQKPTTKTAA